MSTTTGFVGLGIMGKGMIKNLVRKSPEGSKFVIWNRSSEPSEEIASLFPEQVSFQNCRLSILSKFNCKKVKIAATAADVVRESSVTYTMLSTLDASIAVVRLWCAV